MSPPKPDKTKSKTLKSTPEKAGSDPKSAAAGFSPTTLRGGKVIDPTSKNPKASSTTSSVNSKTMANVVHSPMGRGRGAINISAKNGGPNGLNLPFSNITTQSSGNLNLTSVSTQLSEPENFGFGASGLESFSNHSSFPKDNETTLKSNSPPIDSRQAPTNGNLVSEIQKMKLVINHLLNEKSHTGAIPKIPVELRSNQSRNTSSNVVADQNVEDTSNSEVQNLAKEFQEFLAFKRHRQQASRTNTASEGEINSDSTNESDNQENIRQARPNSRSNYRICNEMDKWGFKFDNLNSSLSIKAFLFRVNTLKNTYGYRSSDICKYFHVLLRGEPLNWYYQFLSRNPNPTWQILQEKILERFKSNQTDLKIMQNRKQGKESFESFYNDICSLYHSMEYPKSDKEIIAILRDNMDDLIRQRIFSTETSSLTKFLHICNDAYDDVCRFRQTRKDFYNSRVQKVSEIDEISIDDDLEVLEAKLMNAQKKRSKCNVNRSIMLNIDELSLEEIDEVFKRTKDHRMKNNENVICYNCEKKGHGFVFCPLDRDGIFCFKCGKREVKLPNCPNCQGLNPKGSEKFEGRSRSQ